MDLLRSFCLLLTVVYKIDADYILTEEEYTWPQANEVCTLATPNLNFYKDGITPDLDNQFGDDVWLGYIEKMTPFEYFGCARRSFLKLDTADYITEGDPGQCWSACKNAKAVAVYKNKCYCLQNVNANIENLLDKCVKTCTSKKKLVCGGIDGEKVYVSLYKPTYTGPIETSNSDNNTCLWYNKATTTFSWGQCTERYRIICYKDQEVFLYDDDGGMFGKWKTMTKKCFNKHGIPSHYNNTMHVNTNETAQMWTGIIRNAVIYPVTDSPIVMTGKYAYVTKTRKLLFTDNTTVTKRALCVKESSNAGVIVGVTLSIIVVIIVVIVLVVLWKRGIKLPFIQRSKPEERMKQATNLTYNVCRPDDTIQSTFESSTNDYAEVDVSKMSPGNKTTQNDDTNKISDSSDEPHTYIVLQNSGDGPYNTTKSSTMRQEQDTFNPYNKLSQDKGSNYDHIGTRGESHNKTSATDNPYNTTTLGYSKTNYGITNIVFNKNDESEDTYNHIGDQSCQNGGKPLDNPYNTTT